MENQKEPATLSDVIKRVEPPVVRIMTLGRTEHRFFSYAGLLFFTVAVCAFAVFVYMLWRIHPTLLIEGTRVEGLVTDTLLKIYLAPACVLLAAVLSSTMGLMLLRASGTAGKEVIPEQDFDLLSRLLTVSVRPSP